MEDRAAKASALGVIIIHTAGPATAHALQDVCGCMSYGRGLTGAVYPMGWAMREPESRDKQGGFPRFFMPAHQTSIIESTGCHREAAAGKTHYGETTHRPPHPHPAGGKRADRHMARTASAVQPHQHLQDLRPSVHRHRHARTAVGHLGLRLLRRIV